MGEIGQGTTTPPVVEKLYMENTLLWVAGALFCHDAKRAPTRTQEIELNRGVTGKSIVIRPDPRLGQPSPLAHKIFVALIKKHSRYGRPIRNEVSFTRRELMRLIGRSEWGGSTGEQLTRALKEIHYTFVQTQFRKSDGGHIEQSFNIFPEVLLERAKAEADPIEKCTVTLARPIIASLQEEHFTCLNQRLMQQLSTVAQFGEGLLDQRTHLLPIKTTVAGTLGQHGDRAGAKDLNLCRTRLASPASMCSMRRVAPATLGWKVTDIAALEQSAEFQDEHPAELHLAALAGLRLGRSTNRGAASCRSRSRANQSKLDGSIARFEQQS